MSRPPQPIVGISDVVVKLSVLIDDNNGTGEACCFSTHYSLGDLDTMFISTTAVCLVATVSMFILLALSVLRIKQQDREAGTKEVLARRQSELLADLEEQLAALIDERETVEDDPVDLDQAILDALQELRPMLIRNAQFGLQFLADMGLPQGQGVVGFLTAYCGSLPLKQQNNNNGHKKQDKPKRKEEPATYKVADRK